MEYITFIHSSAKEYIYTQKFMESLYSMLSQYSLDISPVIRPTVRTFGKLNPMLRSL